MADNERTDVGVLINMQKEIIGKLEEEACTFQNKIDMIDVSIDRAEKTLESLIRLEDDLKKEK